MRKRVNEDFSQAQNDAYDICEYLDKYAPTILYELVDYKGSLMNTSKVSFIIDGDWKHDHLYFRDMIEQWANDNGRGIFKIDSKEIGHSYDDSYEAQYDIYITKDQDALDELNSMRRLFVGESLKRRPMREFKEGKASPNKSKESAKVRELIDIIEAPHGLAKINGYRLLPDKLDIINGGQFKITKAQYNRLKELGYGTDESYKRRVNEKIFCESYNAESLHHKLWNMEHREKIYFPKGYCVTCYFYYSDGGARSFTVTDENGNKVLYCNYGFAWQPQIKRFEDELLKLLNK